MMPKSCAAFWWGLVLLVSFGVINVNCAGGAAQTNPAAELRAERERECERVNSECGLSCGTPEILERRIPSRETPAYISTYVRCTAACGKQYELCLQRITDPD